MRLNAVRVTKFLVAGVTVFFFSWIVCVNEWHGVTWGGRRGGFAASTMRTIVGYSEGKQAELDRPSPVTCDRLPALPKVPYINRTWSPNEPSESKWQRVDGTRVSLYAAYYDQRATQHYVRILASFHGRNISAEVPLFCQTRSLNSYEESVEVVAAKPLAIWWHRWDPTSTDVETPLLLSCPLTELLYRPSTVSIVTQPCDDPTNAFTLEPTQGKYKYKRNFTICVKDMNFEKDVSQNLVEWIETNKILGAGMIDVYVDRLTRECEDVLMYYRDQGYVRLFRVPIKHKLERSLWQRRRDHIITYNDCLYRNLGESKFIIPLDIDEIILPKIANTWHELVSRLINRGWNSSRSSSILIKNTFFFGFMQGVDKYRVKKQYSNKSKTYVKRDDVRISESHEIELIDDVNRINDEVIDFKNVDKKSFDIYKRRCGKQLAVPKLVSHIVRSAIISPVGSYSKSFMLTRRVLTAFNHYPLASIGLPDFGGWPAPFSEVQLNHYKESCNTTVVGGECARYGRRARLDTAALRLRRQLLRALAEAACTGINHT